MKQSFIETTQPNPTEDIADFFKKTSEYNARIRAYKYLLKYLKDGKNKKLITERANLEKFFQQLLSSRPSVYYFNSAKDSVALQNLKEVIQSIDEDNQRISIYLANLKYRYAADAIRALDKFAYALSRFNPSVRLQDDIVRQLDELRSRINGAKSRFGGQFSKYWTGSITYINALEIAKYGEENDIYIDALYLAKMIEWYREIRYLMKNNPEMVIKPKEIHPELRRAKSKEREYINSQIELYQANQELTRLRAELAKSRIK